MKYYILLSNILSSDNILNLNFWCLTPLSAIFQLYHGDLSPIRRGFAANFVKYKKGCTRLAAANDKAYQLVAQDRWFSPGTPASSTSKTGRHDIAEILLKVALNTKNSNSKYYAANPRRIGDMLVDPTTLLIEPT
jgi:hypothetical protein